MIFLHTSETPRPVTERAFGGFPDPAQRIETLLELHSAFSEAARQGQASLADWPHRETDFRILAQAIGGLDQPLITLFEIFPQDWNRVSPEVRDRLPGNRTANHKRLVSRLRRAIGWFRPDLDPWSALQVLADTELPTNAGIIGEIRWRADRDGRVPLEVDSDWIARQLHGRRGAEEAKHRNLYHYLVRLSRFPRVRATGLLRDDLAVPPTSRQQKSTVVLPDWLQVIHGESTAPTRNALERLWRTITYLGLSARDPDDLLALIYAGKLRHGDGEGVAAIAPQSWKAYLQRARTALLPHVREPDLFRGQMRHAEVQRAPQQKRRKKDARERTCFQLAMQAVGVLQPPVPACPDTLLSPEIWPRVAIAMHDLGQQRGLSARTVDAYIEQSKRILAKSAIGPVPARLPRYVRPAKPATPKRERRLSRKPALPQELCAETQTLLTLRGYSSHAQRAMVAVLGKARSAGIAKGLLCENADLERIVGYACCHMSGTHRSDAARMRDVIELCSHKNYRTLLKTLRGVGIPLAADPTARLFSATEGRMSLSEITREWAWVHERSLRPDLRKSFAKAVDQLDDLRKVGALLPYLPEERLGPLQSSSRNPGVRHQHAYYPLPRRIEEDVAALDLDPAGEPCFELLAGLHSLYGAARNAGLFAEGQNIGAGELLCVERLEGIARSSVLSSAALRIAHRRTRALHPRTLDASPKCHWQTLLSQVRADGQHNPRADGTGVRIPGFYAVRREALAEGLGPEALTSAWARSVLGRIGGNRTKRSTFRQGLRLLQNWRERPRINANLLPRDKFDDDLPATPK